MPECCINCQRIKYLRVKDPDRCGGYKACPEWREWFGSEWEKCRAALLPYVKPREEGAGDR